jgi:hypothetical protein
MTFTDLLRNILRDNPDGLTPQQLREIIKVQAPDFYDTESNRRNVEKGHYADLDHAVLARIYVASRSCSDIYPDKSQKPMVLSLLSETRLDHEIVDEVIETENLGKLEQGIGTLYVLGTNLFTKEGHEILKIGITTGAIKSRIDQLFTTGVPYKFRLIQKFEKRNYSELEQSMHKMLDPFRISRSREFFTDHCLPYVQQIISLHENIQSASQEK